MFKRVSGFLLVAVIVLAFFAGCKGQGPTPTGIPIAYVNDTPIYKETVEDRILCYQIRNASFESYLSEVYPADKYDEQLQKVWNSPTKQSALQDCIEAEVLRQELEKNGENVITLAKATESASSEYEQMKAEKTTYYTHLKNALTTYSIAEDDYLKIQSSYAYDFYNTESAKRYFIANNSLEASDESLDEQFQGYVHKLVNRANIIYEAE